MSPVILYCTLFVLAVRLIIALTVGTLQIRALLRGIRDTDNIQKNTVWKPLNICVFVNCIAVAVRALANRTRDKSSGQQITAWQPLTAVWRPLIVVFRITIYRE